MIDFVHAPQNDRPADELYAWVSVDEGGEGLIAGLIPGIGASLLVTVKRSNADLMRPIAEQVGAASGKRVRLVRFVRAEIVLEG